MTPSFKFGLLGENISYSKSSNIYKAIFEIKDVQGSFENFDLMSSEFERGFRRIVDKGLDGLSVTIPYKSCVIPLLDEVSPIAKSLDAVNSIAALNGKLQGHNTDIFGFALPLIPYAQQLKKGRALILGSGGAARAVVYSLHTDFDISQFTIVGRSQAKLSLLQQALKSILLNSKTTTCNFEDLEDDPSKRYGIVVNCTPLGGWNQPDLSPIPKNASWPMTKIYYDLNYNAGNKILREASVNGITTIDGSQMLVGQAVRSFEIWTGESVNFNEVYARVFDKIKQSAG